MHADLMRAPCFEAEPDERFSTACALERIMRDGGASIRANGSLCARADPGDRRVDRAGGGGQNAVGDGEVFAYEAACMQLGGQEPLGMRVARDAQQTACPLVQAIDRVIDKRGGVGAEHIHQLLAQRPGRDMPGGERGQGRALGDDDQIRVLIADE